MPDQAHFYVSTPIYYVNDRPHIGHVYTTTIADVLARFERLMGKDVFFLTGTDEHAAKVVDAASERGISVQEWADRNAGEFESTFARLGLTNNDFIRTSEDRHKTKVRQYVKALMDSGDVYLGDYEGWYDAGQEEYVPETKAKEYEYKSPINRKPLVRRKEKNYFFKLSGYRDQLLDLLSGKEVADNRFDVQPTARRNEIIERIKTAEDVPISRTGAGDWGITIPGDEDHTIYVWIDALFNYVTTVDTDERRHYWPADVHLIAKDILWFHAAIWPAMLLALQKQPGYEWVRLPGKVYSHSFWIAEGEKMSKTLGNFIDLEKIDYYVETFGLDALRYFLAAQGPMGTTDSDFSEEIFAGVYNSDLANTVGNSLNRICNMTNRYFDGKLPAEGPQPDLSDEMLKFLDDNSAHQCTVDFYTAMTGTLPDEKFLKRLILSTTPPQKFDLTVATEQGLRLVRAIDNYIEHTAPFKLAKDESKKPVVGTILWNCAEAMRIASILLWPVIPFKAEEIWRRLGCESYVDALADRGKGDFMEWTRWGQLEPGTPIAKSDPLFPRYQEK